MDMKNVHKTHTQTHMFGKIASNNTHFTQMQFFPPNGGVDCGVIVAHTKQFPLVYIKILSCELAETMCTIQKVKYANFKRHHVEIIKAHANTHTLLPRAIRSLGHGPE